LMLPISPRLARASRNAFRTPCLAGEPEGGLLFPPAVPGCADLLW
jgi:hypothetical protein